MALEKIKIRGVEYRKPSIGGLKRKQARRFGEVIGSVSGLEGGLDNLEAMDALWELVEVLLPDLPADTLDDLEFDECQKVLHDAGFYDDDAEGVTAGE